MATRAEIQTLKGESEQMRWLPRPGPEMVQGSVPTDTPASQRAGEWGQCSSWTVGPGKHLSQQALAPPCHGDFSGALHYFQQLT